MPDESVDGVGNDPAELLEECAELYREKNDAYGDAWKLAPKTIAMWCEEMGVEELTVEADTDQLASFSLYIRRLEKIIRSFNGEFVVDEQAFEDIEDGHVDSAPYSTMHATVVREDEDDDASEEVDWGNHFVERVPCDDHETYNGTCLCCAVVPEEDAE